MMDPASYLLQNKVKLPFDLRSMAKEMIEHFCPITMDRYELMRSEMLDEFTVSAYMRNKNIIAVD